MQMRRALATAGKVAAGGLLLTAFAALAIVGANLGVHLSTDSAAPTAVRPPSSADAADPRAGAPPPDAVDPNAPPPPTPAEVLAGRFPAEEPPTFSVASVIPAEPGDSTFDLSALSGMATVEPPWPSNAGTAPAEPDPVPDTSSDPAKPDPAKVDPARTDPSKGPAASLLRRSSARSPTVVNDAMIASIRRRLRLTAGQERLWLPVEAALRRLTYTRAAMNAQRGQPSIDPASPDLRELKTAAVPFIARLNEEQKREVRDIIHVMGLEAVASQF